MNTVEIQTIYKALKEIYDGNAYSQLVLNEHLNRYRGSEGALITKVVYGTIDNNLYLEYVIKCLVPKKPQNAIYLILKIGIYILKFLNIPAYAIVNELVEFTRTIGKRETCGFVNAVLKKASVTEVEMPADKMERLSVKYSYPLWFVKKIVSQYGDEAESVLGGKTEERAHVRVNRRMCSAAELESLFQKQNLTFEKSALNGYYVSYSELLKSGISDKKYTVQSIGSQAVCFALNAQSDDLVLDACAAPGGKSVLIAETAKKVVACDIHAHRVNLIKKYAAHMGAGNVTALEQDASTCREEYREAFSKVLCDVPCSGFGVASSRPDIKLGKTETDVAQLSKWQFSILSNCRNYVKPGGILVYSTCTVLKEENQEVVERFLKLNPDFVPQPINLPFTVHKKYGEFVQLLPHLDHTEGFFIAKLKRV